jgi:hypothetical protein
MLTRKPVQLRLAWDENYISTVSHHLTGPSHPKTLTDRAVRGSRREPHAWLPK